MDQVMPLTHNERKYLIQMTSIKLARHEWRHLLKSSVFLLFSTLHLCGIVMADYSLFWIMTMIRFYGSRGSVASKTAESDGENWFFVCCFVYYIFSAFSRVLSVEIVCSNS